VTACCKYALLCTLVVGPLCTALEPCPTSQPPSISKNRTWPEVVVRMKWLFSTATALTGDPRLVDFSTQKPRAKSQIFTTRAATVSSLWWSASASTWVMRSNLWPQNRSKSCPFMAERSSTSPSAVPATSMSTETPLAAIPREVQRSAGMLPARISFKQVMCSRSWVVHTAVSLGVFERLTCHTWTWLLLSRT
jgi:hypothetical protein